MGSTAPEQRQGGRRPAEHAGADLWQRLSGLTFLVLIAALGYTSYLLVRPELERKQAIEGQRAALREERDGLIAQRGKLNTKLRWLQGDLRYLETHARDQLDLQKPGEFIIRIRRSEEAGEAEEAGE